jgi:hypothetical protein
MNRVIEPRTVALAKASAVTLAVSATLVACSSAPAKVGQPSAAGLKAMALAISDLPFGWAVSPPSTDSSVTSPCPAITSDAGKQLPAQAETDFQQSEYGPFLQDILATGSAQQVNQLWASVKQATSQCSGQTSGSDTTSLSTTSFHSYGDQSYALQLTATRSGVTYSGDIVVVRKGQVFVEVVVFGGGGVPAALVQQLADKAVKKI